MGVLGEVLVVITILGLSFAGLGLLIWHISKPIPPTEPRHRPYDTQPRQRPHDRTGGRKP